MTLRFDLNFQFKGDRNYVQGPDMLNAIIDALSQQLPMPLKSVDLQIHRMTGSNLVLELGHERDAIAPHPDNIATLTLAATNTSWYGRLREADTQPASRQPYDEDSLVALCEFATAETGRQSIFIRAPSPFTPIETFVAMTKALHKRAFPDAIGKWVFCRWVSAEWPTKAPVHETTVTLTHTVGTRLTQSKVALDGIPVGTVYFSAKTDGV